MKIIHSASILPRPLDALLSTLVHRIWWREGYVYLFPPWMLQFNLPKKVRWRCSWNYLSSNSSMFCTVLVNLVTNLATFTTLYQSLFFISPISTCSLHFLFFYWLLQCSFPICFSRCCRHLVTFLHGLNITLSSCFLSKLLETPWLTLILFCMQPHLVLGLISQIIKVSIESSFAFWAIQQTDYRQTSGSLNEDLFVLIIRFNFWLIWTSRRHRSWWNCLMTAR